jgi:hypothetical protein
MTIDTGTFSAITDRLDELEARVAQIDNVQACAWPRVEARINAIFDALEELCFRAGVSLPEPARRPAARHLQLVRRHGGGAA